MKQADDSLHIDPKKARTAHPAELSRIMQNNPTQKLLYMGSDKDFHYIYHSWTSGGCAFRIPSAEFAPPRPFALGSNREPYPVKPDDLKRNTP